VGFHPRGITLAGKGKVVDRENRSFGQPMGLGKKQGKDHTVKAPYKGEGIPSRRSEKRE